MRHDDLNSGDLLVVAHVFVRALQDRTHDAIARRVAVHVERRNSISQWSRFGLFLIARSTPVPKAGVEQINAAVRLCESHFWTREEASRGLRPVSQYDEDDV